jgi:hypothetical protein
MKVERSRFDCVRESNEVGSALFAMQVEWRAFDCYRVGGCLLVREEWVCSSHVC